MQQIFSCTTFVPLRTSAALAHSSQARFLFSSLPSFTRTLLFPPISTRSFHSTLRTTPFTLSPRLRILPASPLSISNLPTYTVHKSTTFLSQRNAFPLALVRPFHASIPPRGIHAVRLVHFVAPIIMKRIKAWIGTPSTNEYFWRRLLSVLLIGALVPSAYIGYHLEKTPYTDRRRFVAMSSDDEQKLGELAYSQLIEEHETNFIPEQHHYVVHVTEVAKRIIEATNTSDITWEVRLVDAPTIPNAFAIPGGKIFVFSGILNVTQNDDGLAFILGHEVAHVLARHGAEQMAVGSVMMGVSVLLSALFGDNVGTFLLSRVLSMLTQLQYSRKMEKEADYIGLLLMHKAGFNINEAPKVWERMVEYTSGEKAPAVFLSTHPSHEDRVIDITKWVGDILQQEQSPGSGTKIAPA